MLGKMLEQSFSVILNMGLTACVVIAAVLLVRLALRRAPRIFSYCLWAVVLFRLLCPISFSAPFSLFGMGAFSAVEDSTWFDFAGGQGQTAKYVNETGAFGETDTPFTVIQNHTQQAQDEDELPGQTAGERAGRKDGLLTVLAWIWFAGAGIMLLYGVVTYLALKRRLKCAVREQGNIYRMKQLETPFVCGILKPRIYLPLSLQGQEKEYILLHEQIHIRRGDPVIRALSFLALCLHWFHPLVWLAFFLSEKDMEMSCDEAVLRKIGNSVKKEYSASLLSFATGRHMVVGVPLAFGEGDTGGRIKNVLRYRKPTLVIICAAVAVTAVVSAVLLANPKQDKENPKQDMGEEQVSDQVVLYGVIEDVDIDGTVWKLVNIPGMGSMEIPEAEEVYPCIEYDFHGLQHGDLVRVTFPKGAEPPVMETYPGRFGEQAEKIEVLGLDFGLSYQGENVYYVTVPYGLIPNIENLQTGDQIRIFERVEKAINSPPILAEGPVMGVALRNIREEGQDYEFYEVQVALSTEEVKAYLSRFENGLVCSVIKAGGNTEEKAEDLSPADEKNTDLITRQLAIMGVDTAKRLIDRYEYPGEDGMLSADEAHVPLTLAENCVFRVNYDMTKRNDTEVDFDTFAKLVNEPAQGESRSLFLSLDSRIVVQDGKVTEVSVDNPWWDYGIRLSPKQPAVLKLAEETQDGADYRYSDEIVQALTDRYYLPGTTETADISDADGIETVQTYYLADAEQAAALSTGLVLFQRKDGELLYVETADQARAGWNNIYVGELDGTPFIMTMYIENRDVTGDYSYEVFRLGEDGEIKQLAGSYFEWRDAFVYEDTLFRQWAEEMAVYLEHSHLVLSTQDGELNMEKVSEAEKYSADALQPNISQ